jgi:hypothetical protein
VTPASPVAGLLSPSSTFCLARACLGLHPTPLLGGRDESSAPSFFGVLRLDWCAFAINQRWYRYFIADRSRASCPCTGAVI